MREMDEYCPRAYSSNTQKWWQYKPTTTTTTTEPHNPNPIYSASNNPRTNRLTSSSPSYTMSTWQSSNAATKRKQRIVSYKAYAVEGKLKASILNSFRWAKNKYSSIVHGY